MGAKRVEGRKQVFVFFGIWTRRYLERVRVDSALEEKWMTSHRNLELQILPTRDFCFY